MDASGHFKLTLIGLGAASVISAVQGLNAALGFTASGITAGWAAKLMPIISSVNEGTVPSGCFLTILQSFGTAGFTLTTMVLMGFVDALSSIIISIKMGIF
ncbi:interferon alpha-inducible protein 27-like protein 2B [Chiloscyllium plagiosum]|uniref:interferon alpha-inducible protein 27-like protein 2B n=1 Tax=Chiloscyllium plagiosum TaxID=36176 RepID=UPI001CB7D5B9|nr:interferon alpha-inducible protein 27-like protein 2B [Chiloscyllium plagiosum]